MTLQFTHTFLEYWPLSFDLITPTSNVLKHTVHLPNSTSPTTGIFGLGYPTWRHHSGDLPRNTSRESSRETTSYGFWDGASSYGGWCGSGTQRSYQAVVIFFSTWVKLSKLFNILHQLRHSLRELYEALGWSQGINGCVKVLITSFLLKLFWDNIKYVTFLFHIIWYDVKIIL